MRRKEVWDKGDQGGERSRNGGGQSRPEMVGTGYDSICHILHNIAVLSWVGFVPSNCDEKAARTIKADKWHTLITVYLTIALISLYGMTGPQSNIAPDLHTMLDHTMDLVSAIYLACAHTMSDNHATAYWNYIACYIGNLKAIYPAFNA